MVSELELRGYCVTKCDIKTGWDAFSLFHTDRARYDITVHAAAQAPHRAAIDGQPVSHIYNAHLDAAMFNWAVRTRQYRVLYLSSCAVLDENVDAYGFLKMSGEVLADRARDADIPVTVVRPFSGYGEDQGEDWPFGAFTGRTRRREDPFTLWNANAVRDWIHIDDVVRGALAVAESGTTEPVSLCTGRGTSCGDLARLFARTAGYEPSFVGNENAPQGTDRRVGDPTLMREVYTPQISLEEGVERALEWWA